MIGYATLREYCFAHAGELGLMLSSASDLSIANYSRGGESYQTQAFFVGDGSGTKWLFKLARDGESHNRLLRQSEGLDSLLQQPTAEALRERSLSPSTCHVGGVTYLRLRYQPSHTLYERLRLFPSGAAIEQSIGIALGFCDLLANCQAFDGDSLSKIEAVKLDYSQAQPKKNLPQLELLNEQSIVQHPAFEACLVHNDLGASNFLQAGEQQWLIDWEYWRLAPRLFNIFDVLVNFGSLLATQPYARRDEASYRKHLLNPYDKRLRPLLKLLAEYVGQNGYTRIEVDLFRQAYVLFLMNKATCQHRVYGASYHFDRFWQEQLEWTVEHLEAFNCFWSAIQSLAHPSQVVA